VVEVDSPEEALEAIEQHKPDVVIVSTGMVGGEIEQIARAAAALGPALAGAPTILYGSTVEIDRAREHCHRVGVEANLQSATSLESLVDAISMQLALPYESLSEPAQQILHARLNDLRLLAGKKALIVDDDIRNIFALTSIMERFDMVTVSAETGRDAINLLQATPEMVDVVLMDIMMPEMDGIDTTRAIRRMSRFKNLPIIAVTAKAMKGDRERCIEAGAWDYLSKPVKTEQMLATLCAWVSE
jgi:CheY-like chemotaxis protein